MLYLGYEVLEIQPYVSLDHGIESYHELLGETYNLRIKYNVSSPQEKLSFLLIHKNKTEYRTIANFFDSKKGSYIPFWCRQHKASYTASNLSSSGSSSIIVTNNSTLASLAGVVRHIYIPNLNSFHKITAFAEIDSGANVALTITPPLSGNVQIGDYIENAYLVRFVSDVLTTNASSLGPGITETEISLIELQGETP